MVKNNLIIRILYHLHNETATCWAIFRQTQRGFAIEIEDAALAIKHRWKIFEPNVVAKSIGDVHGWWIITTHESKLFDGTMMIGMIQVGFVYKQTYTKVENMWAR